MSDTRQVRRILGLGILWAAVIVVFVLLQASLATHTQAGNPQTLDSQAMPQDCVAPQTVAVKGLNEGTIDASYAFTAEVSPSDTATSVTYTWEAVEQTPSTYSVTQLSNAKVYSWSVTGLKNITVTVKNICGSAEVSDVHTITISAPPVCNALAEVGLTGPISGEVDTSYTFTATASPPTSTQPFTYTWEATGQLSQTVPANEISSKTAYSWNVAGPKTVTVTTENKCGVVVSDVHTITIEPPPPPCIPPASLMLTGPISGEVYTQYAYTATVGPPTTTLPVTYTWKATGHESHTHAVEGLSDTSRFLWKSQGTQTITATAQNVCGAIVSDTLSVAIATRNWAVYLPVVLRPFSDHFEPNDTIGQAYGPLVSGQAYVAYIPGDYDPDDFYFIEVTSTNTAQIELLVPDALDLDLYVYDTVPSLVAKSNKTGLGVDEQVSFEPDAPGTYYVRVYPFQGWSKTEAYTLTVTFD